MSVKSRVLSLLLCAMAFQAEAAPYRLTHTFRAGIPEANDRFGTAVAIDGDVIAIKSHSGYFDGDGLSITHVFEQDGDGWTDVAKFEFDTGENNGNFFIGEELAIDDGVIAVGYGPRSDAGTSTHPIQVLSRDATGWSRQFASLNPMNPFDRDLGRRLFAGRGQRPAGRTVSISGDWIIAEETGVQRPDRSGQGVARLFERQGDGSWLEKHNLFPSQRGPAAIVAAAINENTAALVYRSSNGFDEGGAGLYFFERGLNGEWEPTETFLQSPEEDSQFFFRMVRIDGDTAVTRDVQNGILTTYERVDGVWRESVGPPTTASFNSALGGFALEDNLLARTVGGFLDEPTEIEIYEQESSGDWSLMTTITDPDPTAGLDFGAKLSFDGGRLLVGAMSATRSLDPSVMPMPGAAYLFVPIPEPSTLCLVSLGAFSWIATRRAARTF